MDKLIGFIGLIGLIGLVIPSSALAQGAIFGPDICDPQLDPRSCDICAFLRLVKKIIDWLTTIAFLLATIFIIYGGFVIMTAGVSPDQLKKGKSIITGAIVGLIVTLGAWLIISTILHILTGAPPGAEPTGFPWPWNQIQC